MIAVRHGRGVPTILISTVAVYLVSISRPSRSLFFLTFIWTMGPNEAVAVLPISQLGGVELTAPPVARLRTA